MQQTQKNCSISAHHSNPNKTTQKRKTGETILGSSGSTGDQHERIHSQGIENAAKKEEEEKKRFPLPKRALQGVLQKWNEN